MTKKAQLSTLLHYLIVFTDTYLLIYKLIKHSALLHFGNKEFVDIVYIEFHFGSGVCILNWLVLLSLTVIHCMSYRSSC